MFTLPNNSWKPFFEEEVSKEYFKKLYKEIERQKEVFEGEKEILPGDKLIFNAFNECDLDDVKVVIIGQDPYHTKGVPMGLCFSVNKGVKVPPSLKNIYKELKQEYPEFEIPNHGDLSSWAEQGVLMLNTALTVRQGVAGSHSTLWEPFSNNCIKFLSENKENLVFILWGNHAKSKKSFIDQKKHNVLEWTHPSPLARVSFVGNGHFQKTNVILEKNGLEKIEWTLL